LVLEFEKVRGLDDFHVTKIVAGCHSAAITSDEHIYVWGTSTFGQFLAPERSMSLTGVIDASIGRSSGAAVDRDGKVWTWGYNEQAQLGLVDTEPRCIPTLVNPIKKKHVYAIAVGSGHVIAIGENKVQNSTSSDNKRAKSSEPLPLNDPKEETKTQKLKPYCKPQNARNDVKSAERPFKGVPVLTNQNPEIMNVNGFDASFSSDNKYQNESPQFKLKHDLVNTISEAAQKMLKDPNSYYHKINKNEKVPVAKVLEMEREEVTGDFPKVNLEKQFNFSKNVVAPIVPYPKKSTQQMIAKQVPQEPEINLKDHSKNIEAEADKRKKLFESKPVLKKKKVEPPQIKLPPAPQYERLPCLDCKNLQNVCETLKISKIDEVIELVQDNSHSKD
jgi:hypothetical protein